MKEVSQTAHQTGRRLTYNCDEVAAKFGVSKNTIYDAARENRLPAVWLSPRRVVFPRDPIDRLTTGGTV